MRKRRKKAAEGVCTAPSQSRLPRPMMSMKQVVERRSSAPASSGACSFPEAQSFAEHSAAVALLPTQDAVERWNAIHGAVVVSSTSPARLTGGETAELTRAAGSCAAATEFGWADERCR